jgi:hypothetical protein
MVEIFDHSITPLKNMKPMTHVDISVMSASGARNSLTCFGCLVIVIFAGMPKSSKPPARRFVSSSL